MGWTASSAGDGGWRRSAARSAAQVDCHCRAMESARSSITASSGARFKRRMQQRSEVRYAPARTSGQGASSGPGSIRHASQEAASTGADERSVRPQRRHHEPGASTRSSPPGGASCDEPMRIDSAVSAARRIVAHMAASSTGTDRRTIDPPGIRGRRSALPWMRGPGTDASGLPVSSAPIRPAPAGPRPMHDYSQDTLEFRRTVQRSEEHRALVMLGVLVTLAVIGVFRDLGGDSFMSGPTLFWLLALVGVVAAVEFFTLAAARRADAKGHLVDTSYWYGSAIVEALAPTAAILLIQRTDPEDPVAALTPPSIFFYAIVCVLAVLRLRPLLCVLTGAIGALGYAGIVGLAWWRSGLPGAPGASSAGWESFQPIFHFTHAAMIMLVGVICALVAGEVRRWVQSSLQEQTARRRLEVVARNTLIFGLAKLAEYRDSDTGAHLDRISAYCQLLCVPLREQHPEIDGAWVDRLTLASSMHDIGKVGIPDAVLLKPGRLDDAERTVIERHPDLGFRALDAIIRRGGSDRLLEMSADIAACHHERWDGKGYPNGLAGDRIPLAARIVSVADVYDALTSERVYKPAMPHEQAVELIRKGAGSQFDPQVVAAFDRMEASFRKVRDRYAASAESARTGSATAAGSAAPSG